MAFALPTNGELHNLVTRATAGESDALSTLLAAFGPLVEQQLHIGRAWRSAIDSADVMQITYLEAFLQIAKFRPDQSASFEAWLARIAQNNLRDAIRGLERQKQPPADRRIDLVAGDESYVGLYEMLAATSSTPSRAVARKDTRRLIDAALDRLPEEYARTVLLYDLEGRSIADVASALGRSPGAVHMLRARAHARLGEIIETAALSVS